MTIIMPSNDIKEGVGVGRTSSTMRPLMRALRWKLSVSRLCRVPFQNDVVRLRIRAV